MKRNTCSRINTNVFFRNYVLLLDGSEGHASRNFNILIILKMFSTIIDFSFSVITFCLFLSKDFRIRHFAIYFCLIFLIIYNVSFPNDLVLVSLLFFNGHYLSIPIPFLKYLKNHDIGNQRPTPSPSY